MSQGCKDLTRPTPIIDIDGICFAFTAPDAGDNDGKRFSMWDRISAAVLRP